MTKYLTVSIFYSVKNLVRFQIIGQYVGLDLFRSTGGVGHFDEMFLLFKQHLIPADGVYSEIDRLTSKNLLRLWTDFAKTGNPTPDPSDVQWDRCLFLHSVFMKKKIHTSDLRFTHNLKFRLSPQFLHLFSTKNNVGQELATISTCLPIDKSLVDHYY